MRDTISASDAPVTYTATDHRLQQRCQVYEYKGGKFALVDAVDLKKRWPEKWDKEWLGW